MWAPSCLGCIWGLIILPSYMGTTFINHEICGSRHKPTQDDSWKAISQFFLFVAHVNSNFPGKVAFQVMCFIWGPAIITNPWWIRLFLWSKHGPKCQVSLLRGVKWVVFRWRQVACVPRETNLRYIWISFVWKVHHYISATIGDENDSRWESLVFFAQFKVYP